MPVLYIFVGYPGSGKTTVANYICEAVGASHIWADQERQAMFGDPTHSAEESDKLYSYLNDKTAELLKAGHDVVFDTNFNYQKDRENLHQIAQNVGAQTQIIQMTTPVDLARKRALHGSHAERNGMAVAMTPQTFERIVDHLEPLRDDEPSVSLDGTDISEETVLTALKLG